MASDWLLESLKIDPNDLRIVDGLATAHLDAEYSNHSDSPYRLTILDRIEKAIELFTHLRVLFRLRFT